ncbi:aldehyde dehydrogenase family protein [Paenibacillus frigoriresistens]|uniref:aldehyde dehydrogenase family protein n=1 Tax=Paenibacillus alginolyticus TaxID=59839 RepID=UPI001563D488|nr:aldehyde dehydrogenase family protein [Paenibacillus frigoriresistens]NRF94362.1 aldehyde dehydrogenase family protein [Paenibacillus frigoriresistens]
MNGEWTESVSNRTFIAINSGTREEIAHVPMGDKNDVDRAVKAARTAFESEEWRAILPADRGRIMQRISRLLLEQKEELAMLETCDTGKPLAQSIADVEVSARYFEYYAGVADKILGETIPIRSDILDFTLREPLGVTAHIVPWNYPLQIAARSLSAAFATGNTSVIKLAEDTPLTALRLAAICEAAGIPKGGVNVVTGYGYEAGTALASHPDIDHITFTGSVATGSEVMKAAAVNVKPVTLELGGKSPNIVFADANLEDAAYWVVRAITQNAGQTCSAGSRLLVERSIHASFVEIVKEKMSRLRVGPGADNSDIGPVISEKQLQRIEDYMNIANQEGATIALGGKSCPEAGSGFFFEPTIIDGISKESRIANEEIFGPVLAVIPFDSVQEALSIANGTEFGLVTGIWTSDINKAHWLAGTVRSGQVFINNYGAGGGVEMTFGGSRKSGFGREKGLEALKFYTQVKNVAIKFTV